MTTPGLLGKNLIKIDHVTNGSLGKKDVSLVPTMTVLGRTPGPSPEIP